MTSSLGVDETNLFDDAGIADALRITLMVMTASALVISAVTVFLGWRLAPQLALLASASCLVPLASSRFGQMRLAMLFPFATIVYVVLHLAARSEGIGNIGLAVLPVLIMMGAVVLDRRMLVVFCTGTILAVAGMLAIRYFVLRAERYSTNDMGDLSIFALTCATSAVMGRQFAVRIAQGFRLVHDGESRYRDIFENVQDVYYEMHTDGTLLEINPACAQLFGVPRAGMIGRPLAPFWMHRSELDALLEKLRIHGRVSNRELVICDASAELHHVLVNASLQTDRRTGKDRVIGSIRDITEWKRAEDAMRESERTLRNLLEGVQFLAVVTTLNRKILFCNNYALAVTGWSKDEVLGREAQELLGPEFAVQLANQEANATPPARLNLFFEGSMLEKNGGHRRIRWSCTPLCDSSGRVAGFASLGEDVTELRALRAEAARREAKNDSMT
jgi:PAS domain S-box-containing protein